VFDVGSVKDIRTREVLDLLNESLGDLIFEKNENNQIDRKCKMCDNGTLSLKNSFRGGAFIGCSNYPECKFTRPLSKVKASQQSFLAEPKLIGKNDEGKEIFLKNGRFGPYLQYELLINEIEKPVKKKRTKKKKEDNLKNVSIPKGLSIEDVDLEKAKYLCSLPKNIGKHPELNEDITINIGRFGPYLKCSNKSARLETIEDLFSIGLNRAITLIVISSLSSGCLPIFFGNEHKYFAFSKSTSSIDNPFGIETFFKLSSFFFFVRFFLTGFSISFINNSYCK
jgi:DNA topoisomerase-1